MPKERLLLCGASASPVTQEGTEAQVIYRDRIAKQLRRRPRKPSRQNIQRPVTQSRDHIRRDGNIPMGGPDLIELIPVFLEMFQAADIIVHVPMLAKHKARRKAPPPSPPRPLEGEIQVYCYFLLPNCSYCYEIKAIYGKICTIRAKPIDKHCELCKNMRYYDNV